METINGEYPLIAMAFNLVSIEWKLLEKELTMPKTTHITYSDTCQVSYPCQHPCVTLHYDDGTEQQYGHLGGLGIVKLFLDNGIDVPAHFHYLRNDDGTWKGPLY